MPPGILHCVLTIQDSLTQGGHYLSNQLLHRCVRVNQELSAQSDRHTNACHHTALHMFVARHVLHLLQPYEFELHIFDARGQDRVKWAEDTEEWPLSSTKQPTASVYFAHWIALLFTVRTVAPASADNDLERLAYADILIDRTIEKVILFCKFWSMRTRSTYFHSAVQNSLSGMTNQFTRRRIRLRDEPKFWVLKPGQQYPPCITSPVEEES